MPLHETKDTGSGSENSFAKRRERVFIVVSDSTFPFLYPEDAINHPDLPRLYDTHPRDNELVVKNRNWRLLKASSGDKLAVEVSCIYTSRSGVLQLPSSLIKFHFRGGLTTQYIQTDLEGKVIGNEYIKYIRAETPNRWEMKKDPFAKLGANLIIGTPLLIVEFPIPYRLLTPATLQNALATVNSEEFPIIRPFRFPPGTVQLINYDANEIGPEPGDYQLVLYFRTGRMRAKDPVSGNMLNIKLSEHAWYDYQVVETFSNGPGSDIIATREPIKLHRAKVQEEFDYNIFLV